MVKEIDTTWYIGRSSGMRTVALAMLSSCVVVQQQSDSRGRPRLDVVVGGVVVAAAAATGHSKNN